MTPFWCLVYFIIIAVILYYVGRKLLHTLIILNEYKLQRDAPSVSWTYDDMLAMASSKKDSQMSDSEFNIKYGAYRHELYRTTSVTRGQYDFIGLIMHYIELYLIYGGYNRLNNLISIKQPIFIIGDFRSGTSVLERIIEHHPAICGFSTTHAHIWSAPKLFENLVDWLDAFRIECGCEGFNSPTDKGMFYPHSSNNVLSRKRPMEMECIWLKCKRHLSFKRNYDWNTLDTQLNGDNSTNYDLLDRSFEDAQFEKYLKTSIQMLLLHRKCTRFIWKNPINGFRIGYIKKIFPDAKFLFISRHPAKTLKSQITMEQMYCRAHYIDNMQQFRREAMRPRPPYYNKKESWYYLFHGAYPNDTYGHLLFPRVWPRVQPQHHLIQKYLKQDKIACATAVGIVQHERCVLHAFSDKNNGISEENHNLYQLWHEDMLQNPLRILKEIHAFCELDTKEISDEDRIQWLELEDFPNGKANPKRVKQSKQWENGLDFGDETKQVYQILTPCFKRYENRKTLRS